MLRIPALEKLIHELGQLPGIGQKTAQRLAYHILKQPNSYSEQMRFALEQVENNIKLCTTCFSYSEQTSCHFCQDVHRSDETLCIVEEPMDIARVESSGSFRGKYHVLHGTISPLDGITAKDLKIKELIQRIKLSHSEQSHSTGTTPIKELIFAFDADLEGDTTALYLKRDLQEFNLKLTRLAHGVPFGSDIDYVDYRTLGLALDNRIEL